MTAPRIPRDRVLSFGEMLALACTIGVFTYGAIYLTVRWWMS